MQGREGDAHGGGRRAVTLSPRLSRSLTDAAVDALAQEVGVSAVTGVLLDHVDEHLAQPDRLPVTHSADDVQIERTADAPLAHTAPAVAGRAARPPPPPPVLPCLRDDIIVSDGTVPVAAALPVGA